MKSSYQMYEVVNTLLIFLMFVKATQLTYISIYTIYGRLYLPLQENTPCTNKNTLHTPRIVIGIYNNTITFFGIDIVWFLRLTMHYYYRFQLQHYAL